ncbi:MAG TPA: phosphoribosylglycinamide formyltransferase [Feifaniaceae bacterium]|nr:phosphoribosylglycinamide formyltransferase [Feifaniaceae bacterium]
MLKANVGVLVSGGGTNLQALLDAERAELLLHARIALVLSSSKEAYALERAKAADIKALAVEQAAHTHAAFEERLLAALTEHDIDLIVLAGFLPLLSAEFVRRYPMRILNVHPSLIPSFYGKGYYGLKVHEAALQKGVKLTGATVHFVNEEVDGGDILLQKAVEVQHGDTPQTLQRRVMEQAEWVLLPEAVELVSSAIVKEKPECAS